MASRGVVALIVVATGLALVVVQAAVPIRTRSSASIVHAADPLGGDEITATAPVGTPSPVDSAMPPTNTPLPSATPFYRLIRLPHHVTRRRRPRRPLHRRTYYPPPGPPRLFHP